MSYLGNAPARSFISFERQVFTIVNSQTAYTLSHSVTNENDIRLVVNNVVQEPGSGKAYTASGTTLTLSAALTNGTDEMYCVFLGRAVGTVNAPAGSVGTAQLVDLNVTSGKIADDAITLAKMASGTDGNIISYDASGNPVAVATGSAGQVLTSAGAGAPPTFATGGIDGWSSNSGNLLPADASKGIYLGVNSATAANLLDDYEEGSYTTTLTSGLGASVNSWNYTKIGNFVILSGKVTINSTDGSGTHIGMSLPFNSSGRNAVTVNFVSGQNVGDIGLVAYSNNNSSMYFYNVKDNANETNHTNDEVSNGDEYYMTFTYRSA